MLRVDAMQLDPKSDDDVEAVQELARRLRLRVLDLTSAARSSHVGSAFSAAEIVAALYSGIIRVSPENMDDPDRDRFILSKGHAVAILYAVLAERGFIPSDWLSTFYRDDTLLAGHATAKGVPGVEFSTGSLGHGLSVGCGIAYAARLDDRPSRTWVMLSDGECDEGSVWEAAMFAGHHRLDNLIVIVDYNRVQSIGTTKDVLDLDPFADKWRSFGWTAREVDGHDVREVITALSEIPAGKDMPTAIIANTIKGKGVSFMEGTVLWHYRSPQGAELANARRELGGEEV